jgi:hypothetical protein
VSGCRCGSPRACTRCTRPGTRSASISSRALRAAALAALVAVGAGWIAYASLWRDAGAKPLSYRDATGELARFEPPAAAQLLFSRREQLARYVRAVRPGQPLDLPRIDFSRERAVFVSAGPRSATVYALRVASVRQERGRATVSLREDTPSLGDPQQARITYPYRLLIIRKLDKPVYVELQGRP